MMVSPLEPVHHLNIPQRNLILLTDFIYEVTRIVNSKISMTSNIPTVLSAGTNCNVILCDSYDRSHLMTRIETEKNQLQPVTYSAKIWTLDTDSDKLRTRERYGELMFTKI